MSRIGLRFAVLLGLSVLIVACGGDESTTTPATTSEAPAAAPADDAGDTTESTGADPADVSDPGVGAERWPTRLDALDPSSPASWTVEVVATAPHDTGAFTQGLEELDDGRLLESTGRESDVRIVDPATGDVERSVPLADDQFGEGITVVGDTAVQLTWRDEVAPRWTLPDLEPLEPFTYEGEGWGLCLLEDRLAMTDGTSTLSWRDPETFDVLEQVEVVRNGVPLPLLNELECVDGHVVANIWKSSEIVVIRPDGAVVATIDGQPLVASTAVADPNEGVLNGIAAHLDGTFSMTGKLWPTRYVVQVAAG